MADRKPKKVTSYGPYTRYHEVSHSHGLRAVWPGQRLDVVDYNDGSYSVDDHEDDSKPVDPPGGGAAVIASAAQTEPTNVSTPGSKRSAKKVVEKTPAKAELKTVVDS